MLAVCDENLLGKTIEYRDIIFKVSTDFYGGNKAGRTDILSEIKKADIVNIIGINIVESLVINRLVDKDCILWLGDIPHVQIVRV